MNCKVELFLSLMKQYVRKAYGGMEVQLHPFFT
jgi:hypothetical protein